MKKANSGLEAAEEWGRARSASTIICSDCPRNGKTLFAKLAADLLSLRLGQPPQIFDTDEPDGSLIHHFPQQATIIDLSKTKAQIDLFDGMLQAAGGNFLIDLSAHHFTRFFGIYRDIGFEEGAQETGLEISIFFLIDRHAESIRTAANLARSLPCARFIPVLNGAIGDALGEDNCADIYQSIQKDREILLPGLSAEGLGMIEHCDFHFDSFVAGRYDHFPFELKAELWGFLEALYEQRPSGNDGAVHPL